MPERELEYLQKQARRCRSAASATLDVRAREMLLEVAEEYEQRSEALKPAETPAIKMMWSRGDGPMSHPAVKSDVLDCNQLGLATRPGVQPDRRANEIRSEHDGLGHAKVRILQRIAKGLPVNVFERRLIAGHLPPGF